MNSSEKKTSYIIDYTSRYHSGGGKALTKWELIKRFISFLRNPEDLQLLITKTNNILISQNQNWKYDVEEEGYILETDLRGIAEHELYHKDRYIK